MCQVTPAIIFQPFLLLRLSCKPPVYSTGMADVTGGLTKHLDFVAAGALQAAPDDEAVIAALRGDGQPTVEGFARCVGALGAQAGQVQPGDSRSRRQLSPASLLPVRRALELLRGAAAQRAAGVQESAVEAAEAVGEADLRRLKRQFSSLKNTFLHYEVKNEFLAGAWPKQAEQL